jgi:beta-lactam-binding protein with PASTA domain
MRTIRCRKCGALIDASLGECPVCGALYYVLPEEESGAPTPEDDNYTRVFRAVQEEDDGDVTRAFKPVREGEGNPPRPFRPSEPVPPAPPVRRFGPAAPEAPHRAPPQTPPGRPQNRRTLGFAAGALALLAVLVVLFCSMTGVFDFKGSEVRYMPDVLGMSRDLAVTTLEDLDLTVETQDVQSDQAQGTVVSQSIPDGKKLSGNETVLLTVSSGGGTATPSPSATGGTVTVPSLAGYTFDAAKDLLESMGLNIIQAADEYNDKPEGEIIGQDPVANQSVDTGFYVKVTLSKGPEPPEAFTISVTVGKGGSVTPRGQVSVEEGGSASFTIVPDEGYEVREVKVDGENIGAVESYDFANVTENHTLYVVFRHAPRNSEESSPEPTPPAESPPESASPPEESREPASGRLQAGAAYA